MKTTEQWIEEIKTIPGKLEHWLERQYIGEVLAARRIQALADSQTDAKRHRVLTIIANDEHQHAEWVAELLAERSIELPVPSMDDDRYWEPILGKLSTFEEIAAAGHHAETMRLSRIKALANDEEMDADIRSVFARILPDEAFHAAAFKRLSTLKAINDTAKLHNQGLNALGLAA